MIKLTMRSGFLGGALLLALGVTACTRIPGNLDGDKADDAASAWTTLGNRSLPSEPAVLATKQEGARWVDYDPPQAYAGSATQPVQYVQMADGARIAVYLTLPADEAGNAASGKFPTIVQFTGYNTDSSSGGAYGHFPRHGYAWINVDARGTGRSSGDWDGIGALEQADFGPVMDWIVQQDWSDGKLATFGESYVGITALQAAAQQHPAIKAVFAEIALGDWYRDLAVAGGQPSTIFAPSWLLLVTAGTFQHPDKFSDPEYVQEVLTRLLSLPDSFQVRTLLGALSGAPEFVYDGPFSAQRSPSETAANIRVPTFLIGGLYDIFQRGEPLNYERIKANAPAKLLIGPWNHTQLGAGLPADGVPVLNHLALQWFDHYVKGLPVGADTLPKVTQYVEGHGHYVTAPDWPHPQARALTFYLRGDHSLTEAAPEAGEAARVTLQHPVGGLCVANTNQWSAGVSGNLPLPCQYNNELAYATELVYETAPLAEDLYLNGPMQADIWISTTALDAGVSVRVDDMDGDAGKQISSGLQTASLRAVDEGKSRYLEGVMIQPWHSFTQESVQPLTPGAAVLVPVEIFPASALIAKGHRLRISIGASDVTRGIMPLPTLVSAVAGLLTVYGDAEHPSRLTVPVVPAAALAP